MNRFVPNSDGLVTMEWVAIAAIMVLASIGITSLVMHSADATGANVNTGMQAASSQAANLEVGSYGDAAAASAH